jgi:hypothetical protein
MRKKVVKAIDKASAGQDKESIRNEMKRQWHKTPWTVRHELRMKLLGIAKE